MRGEEDFDDIDDPPHTSIVRGALRGGESIAQRLDRFASETTAARKVALDAEEAVREALLVLGRAERAAERQEAYRGVEQARARKLKADTLLCAAEAREADLRAKFADPETARTIVRIEQLRSLASRNELQRRAIDEVLPRAIAAFREVVAIEALGNDLLRQVQAHVDELATAAASIGEAVDAVYLDLDMVRAVVQVELTAICGAEHLLGGIAAQWVLPGREDQALHAWIQSRKVPQS